MSLYEFRTFLLSELRKQNVHIDLIDEEYPLYSANEQVILYFPENRRTERQINVLLMEIMIHYAGTFLVAYAIQNKDGACIVRFELPDGFVSSHEIGR